MTDPLAPHTHESSPTDGPAQRPDQAQDTAQTATDGHGFVPQVASGEERRRISSRSPVAVYVPGIEDAQHVTDYTGGTWPYRIVTLETAVHDAPDAVSRAADRPHSLAVIDRRLPGAAFPHDLFETAASLNASLAIPVVHTGVARDAVSTHAGLYDLYDRSTAPRFGVPIHPPFDLTISCLDTLIYGDGAATPSLDGRVFPTDVVLRDLPDADGWHRLPAVIDRLYDVISGDVRVHLDQPPITGDLVRYIRTHPSAIDSILLGDESVATSEPATSSSALGNALTDSGSYLLAETTPAPVRLATELSLLTSTLVRPDDATAFRQLIDSSVIPRGSHDHPVVQPADPDQTTLDDTLTSD